MKRSALVLVLALAACVDNRSSIEVGGRLPPDGVPSCKFDGASTTFVLGAGVLDVALQQNYRLVVKVTNNLSDPTTVSAGAMKAAKDWYPQAARVTVNAPWFQDTYQPNPALVPLQTQNVTLLGAQTITSAGGSGPVLVEAVSQAMGAQLATAIGAGGPRQVVLGISLQGITADGASIETSDWYFPLTVCSGCLGALPMCTAPQVLTATSCFGAQDSAPVCATPTTP